MEKNENANKRQDFAEGIVDPETAKAVAGGEGVGPYHVLEYDLKAHPGKCPNCGYSDNGKYWTNWEWLDPIKYTAEYRTECCHQRYEPHYR